MEQSQRRAEVLAPLRDRVSLAVNTRLDDRVALQMALVCALRQPDDMLEFMFPKHLAKQATAQRARIAVTPVEWQTMFGRTATPLRDAGVSTVVASREFAPSLRAMGDALRCTVSESEQGAVYARPWTQALCYVGMHMENADGAVETALGTIVRSDMRRMEDFREELDDDGVETMLMSRVLMALSESVL
jgi:hypothetical protein